VSAVGEDVGLGGTEWTVVELAGEAVVLGEQDPAPYLVLYLEESQVAGSTGCNRLAGTFALSEGELRFGPIATTRMACAEDVMAREAAFLEALARVTAYGLEGRSLTLLDGEQAVLRLAC
jgi:heat shock protein HslJ